MASDLILVCRSCRKRRTRLQTLGGGDENAQSRKAAKPQRCRGANAGCCWRRVKAFVRSALSILVVERGECSKQFVLSSADDIQPMMFDITPR